MIRLFKAELRRTFLNESINRFYLFALIIWPLIALIHTIFNLSVFPIHQLKVSYIKTETQLYYFIFIGYCVFILFSNAVQSSWRLGSERFQGTLSQIFLAQISKRKWLYFRSISLILINSWFFIFLFIIGCYLYSNKSLSSIINIIIASLIMLISSWIWSAFISSFFIIMRDGTLLFILLQGPQDTFSGVQVPLNISPKFIQIIGTFFPLSYTIIFLRELLIGKSWENLSSMILMFAMINIIIVIITSYVLKYGEYYLRTSGNFDFY